MTRWQRFLCKIGLHPWGPPVEVDSYLVQSTCQRCGYTSRIHTDTEWS